MTHNSRCELAKPLGKCRCSCGGKYHGIANERNDGFNGPTRTVNENLGGEVGRTIKILTGVPFTCTCGKHQILGGFFGYPHTGGLDDKDGNRWWLYYECENRKCRYEWSWWKLCNRLTSQKRLKA